MQAMTSQWMIGTYEFMIQDFPEDRELCLTVFAKPVDLGNEAADEDAPILAQMDVSYGEVGATDGPKRWPLKTLTDIGEGGLAPEDFEETFGPRMGLRVLLALFQAADRDMRGVDVDARPWRRPAMGAFPVMQRASDLLILLRTRLHDLS
jgi:hypothetical protein